MRKVYCIVVSAALLAASQAYAEREVAHDLTAHDCVKCHTLDKVEAATILNPMIPDAKVLSVGQAPVKGLWEVLLQSGANKGIVYIDYSRKSFISGGIYDLKEKKNLSQERFSELTKVDVSKISLDNSLVLGDKDAKYRVVVFSDPECPYCGKLHEEMKKVIGKRKDIAFFVKLFPLPMHPDAEWKAKTIVCKNSMQLMDDNFEGKKIDKAECDTKVIDANRKLAEEFGINGTPALILPDGRIVSGYREADVLIEMITK
ncbi:MAG TPA: DsbC family protein [Dissulfurispiraceae bacterium]|nr:DsbC family protein [Dissulfurispiraceae bacterium]